MSTNNFDSYFKDNIKHTSDILDKNSAWEKLEHKRQVKTRKTVYNISIISVIIVLLVLPFVLINKENANTYKDLTEEQKQHKLFEIEKGLYEKNKHKMICNNCDGFIKNLEKQEKFIN